ncbi:MAG: outer membrane beta-barrel protein [Porphyromonas sp.]|nr:outer membrane beta-barrel protein [Porphyromonas sp.]
MKKLFNRLAALAIAIVATTTSLSAQLDFEDARYRAEAGITASKISNFGIGENLYGLRVSGQVLVPFQRSKWGLLTGLTLTNKGERQQYYVTGTDGKASLTNQIRTALMYLQLPVNVSHRFDLNRNNRIYFEFGPYLAYALSGKAGELDLTKKVNGVAPFKPFEVGVGASLHYDYKNIYLKAGVEYSLTAVANNSEALRGKVSGGTPRYGLGYITLGYQF